MGPKMLTEHAQMHAGIYLKQAVGLALSFLPVKEAVLPTPLLTFHLGKEALSPRQLFTFLQRKEAILHWHLLTFLPRKEAALCWQPLCQQLHAFLLRKEAVPPRLLLTFPLGKVTVLPRQVNQAIKLGQSGKALGILPDIEHPRLPRRLVLSPRKTTPPLPPPIGFPKGLLMKNLTLSGSFTFPTNS